MVLDRPLGIREEEEFCDIMKQPTIDQKQEGKGVGHIARMAQFPKSFNFNTRSNETSKTSLSYR